MSRSANKLRLGPLPKTETVRLTIALTATLKADLDRYAALHAQIHGAPVDAVTLIPHMLEAFVGRDRGFKKGQVTAPRLAPAPQPDSGSHGLHQADDVTNAAVCARPDQT